MKFCIVGTGRCGTRLLRTMLNSHPDLFVFNETHWIPKLYEFFGTSKVETRLMLDIVGRTYHVTGVPTTELDSQTFLDYCSPPDYMTVVEFCDALGGYFATQANKSQWADKTPDYGFFAAQLQVYWPNCKIIHLIRDGAAVVNSMSSHIGYKGLIAARQYAWCPLSLDFSANPNDYPPSPVSAFADLWYHRLIRIRDEASRLKSGTYIELRHEDVLRAPDAELRRLAEFTGLRSDETWLANAGSLIDTERTTKPRPIDALDHFTAPQLDLLQSLGYAGKPSKD